MNCNNCPYLSDEEFPLCGYVYLISSHIISFKERVLLILLILREYTHKAMSYKNLTDKIVDALNCHQIINSSHDRSEFHLALVMRSIFLFPCQLSLWGLMKFLLPFRAPNASQFSRLDSHFTRTRSLIN